MINNTYWYFPNEVNTSAHDPKTQFFYNNKILKNLKKNKRIFKLHYHTCGIYSTWCFTLSFLA